jgi:serine phosphatase RsbU (regulator of sigma subunit)/ligand-binding sensor domain-containing protein
MAVIGLLFHLLSVTNSIAQVSPARQHQFLLHPYIRNITPQEYKQSSQNWMVAQDNRGVIYVANNDGVLEYDGKSWRMIAADNTAMIYSIRIDPATQRVYVGGENEVGYLAPDGRGQMTYHSLMHLLPEEAVPLGIVWDIQFAKGKVYFQTTDHILVYQPAKRKFNIIWEGNIQVIVKYDQDLYVRDRELGFLKMVGDTFQAIPGTDEIKEGGLSFILPHESGQQLIGTRDKGLFLFNGKRLLPYQTDLQRYLELNDLYHGIRLKDGSYALATTKGGIVRMDAKGKLIQVVNEANGLLVNDSYFIYEDATGGIWAALGVGLSRISPFPVISQVSKFAGSTVAVEKVVFFQDEFYVASTFGCFYSRQVPDAKGINSLTFLPVTNLVNLEIWHLLPFEDHILAITDNGVYSIRNRVATLLFDANQIDGYYLYRSKKNPKRVFLGLREGFGSMIYQNGKWLIEDPIDTTVTNTIRNITEDNQGNLWIGTNNEGFFRMANIAQLDKADIKAGELTIEHFGKKQGLHDANNCNSFNIHGKMYFVDSRGLYRFDEKRKKFVDDTLLGSRFNKNNEGVLRVIPIDDDDFWIISYFNANSSYTLYKAKRNHANGSYEFEPFYTAWAGSIKQSDLYRHTDSTLWVSHSSGLTRYDEKIKYNFQKPFQTLIRRVTAGEDSVIFGGTFLDQNSGFVLASQPAGQRLVLPHSLNTIRFDFSATSFDNSEQNKYQFYLEGLDEGWSNWTDETYKEYTNLFEGDYKLHLRSKNIFGTIGTTTIYEFTIKAPWQRTWWAYLIYTIFGLGSVWLFVQWRLNKLKEANIVLEKKVAERTAEVVQKAKELEDKNQEITQQNEEISMQRDEIMAINESIQEANVRISLQRDEIEHKNHEITDSIVYARRIQDAILPSPGLIKECIPNSFVLYMPKDIVSGDFFWFSDAPILEGRYLLTAADCTGHGIPGAFMSVMGSSLLNQIVNEKGIIEPGPILNALNDAVRKNLHQESAQSESKDGMDINLSLIDFKNATLHFAGANNPLYFIRENELTEYKVDKYPIGGGQYENRDFKTQTLDLLPGDTFYMFSDGFPDQFGGPRRRKFMYKIFKELLVQIHELPLQEQHDILQKRILDWMEEGNIEQIDDILVIGVRYLP